MNRSICPYTNSRYVVLLGDWFEHSYCGCNCEGSGLAAKLGCRLQTDISECRDPAMNLKQPHEKRKREILFFCKGKGLGPQSVSLSAETTLQHMNNTLCPLCENSLFWVHVVPVSQTSWLIGTCFQALCWYNREIQSHREHWPFQASQNAKL